MIKVNEIFGPTIQGEGASVGKEVTFLRLSGCNLHCVWCDTPYTWNWIGTSFAHPDKYDPKKESHEMSIEDIYEALNRIPTRALVISGGEPLIQQKQLLPLIHLLKKDGWWIEVETNGTIPIRPEFGELIDQFNCSPKLSNSGDPLKLRIRENTLRMLGQDEKVFFKFVVGSDQDVEETLKLIEEFDLVRVYLMPLGKTAEELEKTLSLTKALAEKHQLLFSPRLHVSELGGGRGI